MHRETKQSFQTICAADWWAVHQGLSCRNFNSCLSTSEALSGRPGRSAHQKHGRYLYRPCLNTSGTLVLPCSTGPSVPWHRISKRHSSYRRCGSPGTHGRSQGIWSIGRVLSASASRTTAVFTPPKWVKSLQGPSSAGLPSAKHWADTTSSFETVSSRSLMTGYTYLKRTTVLCLVFHCITIYNIC